MEMVCWPNTIQRRYVLFTLDSLQANNSTLVHKSERTTAELVKNNINIPKQINHSLVRKFDILHTILYIRSYSGELWIQC